MRWVQTITNFYFFFHQLGWQLIEKHLVIVAQFVELNDYVLKMRILNDLETK